MKRDLLIGAAFVAVAGLVVSAATLVLGSRRDPDAPATIKPKPEPIALLPQSTAQQEKKKPAETVRKIPIKPAQVEAEKKKTPEPSVAKKQAEPAVVAEVKPDVGKVITQPETAKPDAKPEPRPAVNVPAPAPVNGPDLIELGNLKKINRPAGEFIVERLEGASELTLVGKVKTLKIAGGANGRATLDASGLEAREIIINGEVTGSATLKLFAPAGHVVLRSLISGNAQVELNAPDGRVIVSNTGSLIVTAGARLTIVARDVDLNGAIDGGAQANITLTTDGSLKFSKLLGGARLRYAKANAADPEPRLERGIILGGAQLRKLDPVKR